MEELTARGTPSRRVRFSTRVNYSQQVLNYEQAKKKTISYIESDSEGTDDDDVFKPTPAPRSRASKRRRLSDSADEDVYEQGKEEDEHEDGIHTASHWIDIR